MRAISIRQPWTWLIVNGYKDIENRNWSTDYRGPILIHAAKTMDRRPILPFDVEIPTDLQRGGVIGQAVLVDCVEESNSPWFTGPYGFVLSEATPLLFVACVGASKIFNLEISPPPPAHTPSGVSKLT